MFRKVVPWHAWPQISIRILLPICPGLGSKKLVGPNEPFLSPASGKLPTSSWEALLLALATRWTLLRFLLCLEVTQNLPLSLGWLARCWPVHQSPPFPFQLRMPRAPLRLPLYWGGLLLMLPQCIEIQLTTSIFRALRSHECQDPFWCSTWLLISVPSGLTCSRRCCPSNSWAGEALTLWNPLC